MSRNDDPEKQHADTLEVARRHAASGKFPVFLEIGPRQFEVTRPDGVVYRFAIGGTLGEPKAYYALVEATLQPAKRWKRTDYTGHGRTPALALDHVLEWIKVDLSAYGDD